MLWGRLPKYEFTGNRAMSLTEEFIHYHAEERSLRAYWFVIPGTHLFPAFFSPLI
jgi:hypothetical protein